MVYIVFLTETKIGYVFTELAHALRFTKSGQKHQRLEVWANGKLSGVHINP